MEKTCPHCGTTFEGGRADKVYCSARCNERAREKRKVQRRIDYVRDVKSQPCADCGISYPYFVMDLDHVRGEKVDDLSNLVYRGNMEAVVAEVAKCDVVCANCHRHRTFNRANGVSVLSDAFAL